MLIDGIELRLILSWTKYLISSHGALWSLPRQGTKGGWIKGRPHCGDQHFYVILHEREKKEQTTLGKLVALAWIGPPPINKPFVLHGNGDCWDDCVLNLRYGTQKENMDDRSKHGTGYRPPLKLDREAILDIRERLAAKEEFLWQIGERHNVSGTTIRAIRDKVVYGDII